MSEETRQIAILPADKAVPALRALQNVTATDKRYPRREVLECVQIEVTDGKATFCATDSYRLGAITLDAPDCSDVELLVPPDALVALRKAYRGGWRNIDPLRDRVLVITEGEDKIRLQVADDDPITRAACDGIFPRWRELIPNGGETDGHVALNPGFLASIDKVRKDWGATDTSPVRFTIRGERKPIHAELICQTLGGTLTWLQMPIRVDGAWPGESFTQHQVREINAA